MSNIYDTANQLERDLRDLAEFKTVKASFEAIEADETAKALFDEFRQVNIELQQKQYSGQDINRIITNPLQELYNGK